MEKFPLMEMARHGAGGNQVRSGEGLGAKAVCLYVRIETWAARKLLSDCHAEQEWGGRRKEEEREEEREGERKGGVVGR